MVRLLCSSNFSGNSLYYIYFNDYNFDLIVVSQCIRVYTECQNKYFVVVRPISVLLIVSSPGMHFIFLQYSFGYDFFCDSRSFFIILNWSFVDRDNSLALLL